MVNILLSELVFPGEKYVNEYLILTGMERFRHKDILRMVQEIFNEKIDITYVEMENKGH